MLRAYFKGFRSSQIVITSSACSLLRTCRAIPPQGGELPDDRRKSSLKRSVNPASRGFCGFLHVDLIEFQPGIPGQNLAAGCPASPATGPKFTTSSVLKEMARVYIESICCSAPALESPFSKRGDANHYTHSLARAKDIGHETCD
jgi:hypothetical protein